MRHVFVSDMLGIQYGSWYSVENGGTNFKFWGSRASSGRSFKLQASSSDEVTWQEIFDDSELKKYVPSGDKRLILYFFISSRLCLDTLT